MSNSLSRGFYSGLIAGIVAGIGITFSMILLTIMRLPASGLFPQPIPFDLVIEHLGYAIGVHGIMGAVFGIIYSKFYGGIPGSGVKKGLTFGCIVFLFTNLYIAFYLFTGWLLTGSEYSFNESIKFIFVGLIAWIPFGFVLEALYERLKL